MKNIKLDIFLFLSLIFATCKSQPVNLSTNKDIFEYNRQLGKAINFGNALEAPNEGEWGIVLQEEYFELAKQAGFNSIRQPVKWSAHTQKTAPYTIDETFFKRVDWAIEQATKRGLNIIINIHHYEEFDDKPTENLDRWLAIWAQISERYKNQSDKLYFELYNEPHFQLNTFWNNYLLKGIATIRKHHPNRPIIIGGINWNSYSSLQSLVLPAEDKYLIATFHYYEPFQFTHQSAEWVEGSNAWQGTTWTGTESQKKQVIDHFTSVKAWATGHNRPIFLGEFGAYSKADAASRVSWTTFVRTEAEKQGFSWAYWEFGAGFGIYDRDAKKWREDLKKALIP